ncbi:MAG: hypothetical protein U0936_18520 [Planctomycetaceae bacterium]
MTQASSIVVVGGGPAGAATVLSKLAQSGCDVVLLERQQVAGWKDGETLPPNPEFICSDWVFGNASWLVVICHVGVVSVWGHSTPLEKTSSCLMVTPGSSIGPCSKTCCQHRYTVTTPVAGSA